MNVPRAFSPFQSMPMPDGRLISMDTIEAASGKNADLEVQRERLLLEATRDARIQRALDTFYRVQALVPPLPVVQVVGVKYSATTT